LQSLHCALLLTDFNPFVRSTFDNRCFSLCPSFKDALEKLQKDVRCSVVYPDKLNLFRKEYESTYEEHVNKIIQSLPDYHKNTVPDTIVIIEKLAAELTPERATVK